MDIKFLNEILKNIIVVIILLSIIVSIYRKIKITRSNTSENKLKIIKEDKINKYYWIIFLVIIVVAIFTRKFKITSILNGLHVDEAGMGYDAFCIANYGVDRYLNKLPVYMVNFGGGQSSLYTYLAAIFVKIFGLNTLTIRLPGIILSILAIIAGGILIRKTHGQKSSLVYMCLMVICPWHVMQSRFGLDCNLLSSMTIISITALILSKKWWHYLLAGILLGLTLYSYALSYITIPILLFLTIMYLLYIKKIKFKNVIIVSIPIIILTIPLILMLLVNMGCFEQINGVITIPKLLSYRGEEINFDNISENLKQFKIIITSGGFIYNSIPEFGTIYLFAIPLSMAGIVLSILQSIKAIKNRRFNVSVIMIFLLLANTVLVSLTNVNVNKVNSIYICLIYFVFLAIKYIYKNFKIGFYIITLIYLIMSLTFFIYYYTNYNEDNKIIDLVNKDAITVTKTIQEIDKNKTVYMYLNTHEPWIYVLYALQLSPYEFNETKRDDNIENWNNQYSFGRYYFELPDKVDKNAIYVIDSTDENIKSYTENLTNQGFITKESSRYTVYYREDRDVLKNPF